MTQFNLLEHGLFPGLITGGNSPTPSLVNLHWRRAVEAATSVGTCREDGCGGELIPLRPRERDGPIAWYEAECSTCGHTVAAPAGRVLRRSSRHDEMPSGWWTDRITAIRESGDYR